ncbi:helix-turn-helix transcriptional regulator [Dyella dinghuensis]|uniref:Helix-turn-helix transcriptional regulator n=1 Tax=Dyella dinghuensis TaxID=1920169 RepID=A0A3S0WMJ4_9GAMM|nr:LuxR C-terminal-related transcriptional regulator [Dyella dinghuensis]RUL62261.1 helix-turn-helix transcriptional regulator [Dyella dinghuensis]
MNLLSVASGATTPVDLGWVQDWHDLDDPDEALRRLLESAWRAVGALQGTDVVLLTAMLRKAFLQKDRFLRDFPCDEVETLLALGSLWEDDIDEAMFRAQSVLARGTGARYRSTLTTVMKFCSWRTRDFMPFYELSRGKAPRGNAMSVLMAIINLSIEAAAEAEQLRFKLAERLAKDALFLCKGSVGTEAYASLLPTSVLAQLHYEAGAVDDADTLLRGRLSAIEESGAIESALIAYILSAKIAAARGNQNIALLLLHRGEQIGVQRRWHRLVLGCKAEEVALHIHDNRLDRAETALAQLNEFYGDVDAKSRPKNIDACPMQIANLRLQLANGPGISTARSLDDLRNAALHRNHPALVVKLTILLSSALYTLGQITRAHEELLAALHQGATAGLFRSFLDDMPLIEAPLRQLWRSGETRTPGHLGLYIGRLLTTPVVHASLPKKFRTNHRLVESLSARETIILRLMSLGLSNKSIARELQITPETVKSHAKHIFIKLASKNRAEAVSRATELGLI